MDFCQGVNLTEVDFEYLRILHIDRSWAWWLNQIGTLVIFFVGCGGNFLCLLILCRRPLIRSSYAQYLIALAIVDTGAILSETLSALDGLNQFLNPQKLTLFKHTDWTCKFYSYIRYIFYSMSSWIVVALAVERLVAVRFPLWSKYLCSVTNARRIIIALFLFAFSMLSYQLVIKGIDCSPSNIQKSNETCRCKTTSGFGMLDITMTIYIWRLILMTLLPLTIIMTANVLIMRKLFEKSSLVDHRFRSTDSRRKMFLLHKISRMLVVVSSVYLVLHVPGSTFEILKFFTVQPSKPCNFKLQYYLSITHDVFDLLTNLNYGINFYLYIISGKHIRKQFIPRTSILHHFCTRRRSSGENLLRLSLNSSSNPTTREDQQSRSLGRHGRRSTDFSV